MAIRQPKPTKPEFPVSKYHGRRMSEAEYLALPEEKPYLEYVDGVVLEKPMPNRAHRTLVRFIDFLLELYIEQNGGDGGPEGRMRLPDGRGYRLPDTAYWVPGRPSGDDSVPSVVFEILSPSQRASALRTKCRMLRQNGVDLCWLIDPVARTVEVFDGKRDGVRLAPDEPLETSVMPGFWVTQEKLFGRLDA